MNYEHVRASRLDYPEGGATVRLQGASRMEAKAALRGQDERAGSAAFEISFVVM